MPQRPVHPDPFVSLSSTSTATAPTAPTVPRDNTEYTLCMPTALSAGGIQIDRQRARLNNVAIMSIGPAIGHGFELDARSLQTLVDSFNRRGADIGVRLTHPNGFTIDGVEVLMGIAANLRVEGDVVRGDIHFGSYSTVSPAGGNLQDYLLRIAEEHPSLIGMSIVARFDFERVVDQRTGEIQRLLGRVKFLKAVDFVGDPAANRNGLLSTPPANTVGQPVTQDPQGRESTMNKKLRAYLQSIGLSANATDAQALAYLQRLEGEQRTQADALATRANQAGQSGQSSQSDDDEAGNDAQTPPANQQMSAPGNSQQSTPPAGNAAPAQTSQPASLTAADVDRATQAALNGERQRVRTIQTLATQHGMDQAWVTRHTAEGTDEAGLNRDILATLAHRNQPVNGLGGYATGGEDGRVSLFAGMRDAIMLRSGLTVERPHQRVREFHHLSLVEAGRRWLQQLGVRDVYNFPPEDVARICLNRMELAGHIGSVALSHTTSDLPNLFGDLTSRILVDGYEQEPSTCEAWSSEMFVNDFRETKLVMRGAVPLPPRVFEGGEYQYVTFGDKAEKISALKFGMLLALTWEMFINDDLNALVDKANDFTGACRALENDIMYGLLISNPAMAEDNKTLFHEDHGNLNEGGAAVLDGDSLAASRLAMRLQKGIAPNANTPGRKLGLMPATLLVPVALEVKASQLLASLVDLKKNNNAPSYQFLRNLTLVSDQRLDENSSTKWYVKAGNRSGGARRAYLRNHRQPHVESQSMPINMDGVAYKCRHVTGGAIDDYRVWQANNGAVEEG